MVVAHHVVPSRRRQRRFVALREPGLRRELVQVVQLHDPVVIVVGDVITVILRCSRRRCLLLHRRGAGHCVMIRLVVLGDGLVWGLGFGSGGGDGGVFGGL